MSHPAISVENLSKAYRIGLKDAMHDTLVGAVKGMLHAPFKNWRRLSRLDTFRNSDDAEDIFWALRDVSFEVEEGEVLGIIGRNGAGKSTLLKILSRITEPTSGRAVIRGRVSSLLEVGTGFHPELSGRDNIYMNGTILGMTKREIDGKLDQIIDFSGVEKFLDTPVKRYSSGMKVRLAFAVAAHLEPEILIIDEVLAVGDAEFQRKCLGKMHDVAESGRTVLFVSHNMAAVENLCGRALLLEDGAVVQSDESRSVIRNYLASAHRNASDHRESKDLNAFRAPEMTPVITAVRILDCDDEATSHVFAGDRVIFEIEYNAPGELQNARFGIRIETAAGENLLLLQSTLQGAIAPRLGSQGTVRSSVEELPLIPGKYFLTIGCSTNGIQLDLLERAFELNVEASDFYGTSKLPSGSQAKFLVRANWTLPSTKSALVLGPTLK